MAATQVSDNRPRYAGAGKSAQEQHAADESCNDGGCLVSNQKDNRHYRRLLATSDEVWQPNHKF